MPGEQPPQREPGWKRQLLFWAAVFPFLLGLAALGFSGVGWFTDLVGITGEDGPGEPRLEVRQATPINRPDVYEAGPAAPLQTRPSTPQIAVTVSNRGEEPALLERVIVTIVDSARLPLCPWVGAAGPVPGYQRFYPIKLPWMPVPDELVVRHEMQQEVPAGRIGQFTFFFRTPSDFAAAHLYDLRVGVVVDGARRPLGIGRFLVGVPGPVPRTGFHLPEREEQLEQTFAVEKGNDPALAVVTTWCYRRNVAELRRLLRGPGRRAPAVASLGEFRPADNWPRVGDRRSARDAIEPLLSQNYAQGPMLAVFAAERTGDAELVRRTRERAVRRLVGWAREQDGTGIESLANARAAYLILPSAKRRALVREAETEQLASEESLAGE